MSATDKSHTENLQRRSLLGFYSAGALRDIIPIYPLYSVMFLETGVSPFELSVLFIIWATVGLILEVPSGALADAFSRKWLVIISGVLKSCAFLSWFFWQEFWGYALGFILWGIGATFRSGAFEALLYETLKSWQKQPDFPQHYTQIRSLGTICVLLGEASGGILISYGYDLVLLVSAAVPILVTVPFLLFVTDTKKQQAAAKPNYIRSALMEAQGNPTLLMILFVTTTLLTVHGVFDEFVPPLFREHGFSLAMIAFLAIPIFAAQAIGELAAARVAAKRFPQLLLIIALGSLFLIPAALFSNYFAVFSLTVFFFVFGLAGTLLETQLQEVIQGEARATVTSLIGLGDSIGAIAWFLLVGLVAEQSDIAGATLFLAAMTLVICYFARRFKQFA